MKKLRPHQDYLLLSPLPQKEVSTGGIILPESSKERKNQGTIIAEGPECPNTPFSPVKGDIVVFPAHDEYRLTHHGEEYILVRATSVIAILA